MRTIKFRGKRVDDGVWVYGSLIDDSYIVFKVVDWNENYFNTEYWWKVIPETVGQFTGLLDKNGKEIYEGDIVLAKCSPSGKGKSSIKIHKCIFDWSNSFTRYDLFIIDFEKGDKWGTNYSEWGLNGNAFEVIGNIHDNKEIK